MLSKYLFLELMRTHSIVTSYIGQLDTDTNVVRITKQYHRH